MAERRTINKVVGNTVASLASQPPGSRAIVVEDDDFNVDTSPQIDLNVTLGFAHDVYYRASSANTIAKTALIRNNVVQHPITRSEKKASKDKSAVIFYNNQNLNGRLLSLPRSEYEAR